MPDPTPAGILKAALDLYETRLARPRVTFDTQFEFEQHRERARQEFIASAKSALDAATARAERAEAVVNADIEDHLTLIGPSSVMARVEAVRKHQRLRDKYYAWLSTDAGKAADATGGRP
jgi:hypothetical protein